MNHVAAVYNPHDRSVSVIAELEVQGFLMHDLPERFDLAEQFDRVLGPFTQRPGVKRVTLQERTLPTTIRAAREHYDTVRRVSDLNPDSPVARNYQDVMDRSERFEVAHRNYLILTLDLVALGSQLKALGGGKDAILALAQIEAGNLADALTAAKIKVRRWLAPRDVAALGPARVRPGVRRDRAEPPRPAGRGGPGRDGADVPGRAEGPQRDRRDRLRRAHHDVGARVAPLRLPGRVPLPRRVRAAPEHRRGDHAHLLHRPHPRPGVEGAEADPGREEGVARQRVAAGEAGRGRVGGGCRGLAALEQQEQEIANGHGEFQYGAYLTITAPDEERLDQAIAGMRNALSRAGMEAQILYCQQAEALMVNALPIGLGMK